MSWLESSLVKLLCVMSCVESEVSEAELNRIKQWVVPMSAIHIYTYPPTLICVFFLKKNCGRSVVDPEIVGMDPLCACRSNSAGMCCSCVRVWLRLCWPCGGEIRVFVSRHGGRTHSLWLPTRQRRPADISTRDQARYCGVHTRAIDINRYLAKISAKPLGSVYVIYWTAPLQISPVPMISSIQITLESIIQTPYRSLYIKKKNRSGASFRFACIETGAKWHSMLLQSMIVCSNWFPYLLSYSTSVYIVV